MRVVTDNSVNYRAKAFTRTVLGLARRHQRIRPYTPRRNGKVERYNRILAKECLHASEFTSEDQPPEVNRRAEHHYNSPSPPHRPVNDQQPVTESPCQRHQRHDLMQLAPVA